MIERSLGQWRHLHPLVRQHFPFNRRRKHYYFDHSRRANPLRNQLMIAQSEDFIDRYKEYTNNFYFNQRRVPYYSGKYSVRNYRQNIPERKRRFHHSFSRLASRPRHYDHHQDHRSSSQDYWQEDYQLRDYFYYG